MNIYKQPPISQILNFYKHHGLVGEERLAILQTLLAIKKTPFGIEALSGCLVGDTTVWTENGAMSLRDVIESDDLKIQSIANGRIVYTDILGKFKKGKKPVYKLKLTSGKETLVTKNHLILTSNGWRKVSQLIDGNAHYVYTARHLHAPLHGLSKDAELARLLGYFVGDGGINGTVGWSFTNQSKEVIADVSKILAKHFNCYLKQEKGCKYQYRVAYYNKDYSFRDWIIKNDCNKLCYDKEIPGWITQTQEYMIEFLRGLFATDGHVLKDLRGYEITLANKKLVYQIMYGLLLLGIHSRISYKKSACNGKRFDSWRLTIYDHNSVLHFTENIDLVVKEKCQRQKQLLKRLEKTTPNNNVDIIPLTFLPKIYKRDIGRITFQKITDEMNKLAHSDVFFDKVEKIEYYGREEVYDLETGTHNFIANGLVVHNSGKSVTADLLLNYKKHGDKILLPRNDVYILGLTSKTAASYDAEKINNAKIIYIEELQKAGDNLEVTELLKNIGEGKESTRLVRDQANRRNVSYTINKGKGVLYTLALENDRKNDAEMKRRYITLTTDVSQKQTRAVVARKGQERFCKSRLDVLSDEEIEHLKMHISDCINIRGFIYENPFAEYLSSIMPTPDQKVRSFIDHYFDVIESCTLYHYKDRIMFKDAKERFHILINIQDVIIINLLYSTFYNRDVHSIPPLGLEVLEAFKFIDVKKTINNTRNVDMRAFLENQESSESKVWASIVDIRTSLKENLNIILSHKVTLDTCNDLYNAGYLERNTAQGNMIEYRVSDKVVDFSDNINWNDCFNIAKENIQKYFPEHYDKWLASQVDEDGNIYFINPFNGEKTTIENYLKATQKLKDTKEKNILMSSDVMKYLDIIKNKKISTTAELLKEIPQHIIDILIVSKSVMIEGDNVKY